MLVSIRLLIIMYYIAGIVKKGQEQGIGKQESNNNIAYYDNVIEIANKGKGMEHEFCKAGDMAIGEI